MTLTDEYRIPSELSAFIDDGSLVALTPRPDEKMIEFDIPGLAYRDERGRDFSFTLVWIHPEFNRDACHYYDETPGDLPNFYVVKEARNKADQHIDFDSVDELVAWLKGQKVGG